MPAVRAHPAALALLRKVGAILLLMGAVLLAGTIGYVAIEGWSWSDGLYMTVITVSSVGYGEVHPLSQSGRVFTMLLILSGSGVLIYSVSSITALVVEGDLSDVLKRMAMTKSIANLKDHFIVCGESQTGHYVIEELGKTGCDFVVIEKVRAKVEALRRRNILCLEGDATADAVLREAGVERARGLLAALHSDAENLFVVLTAKGLNPALKVVSKALDEESREKLARVGADGVVMPNHIGAMRMVSEMIRPGVVTFLDLMLRTKDKTIRVEEVVLPTGSRFAGKALQDTGMLDEPDVTVVALVEPGGGYRFNPSRHAVLEEGRTVIVMGNVEGINHIRRKAEP